MPLMDWKPSASMSALKERAGLYKNIRSYFYRENVMEVETPMLSDAATPDVYIDSFQCDFKPIGGDCSQPRYLHTSPEFAMKRLLAAGSGDIYSMGRVFRNGEVSNRHSPEFTLLEWYRLGIDEHKLMDDITCLLNYINPSITVARYSYKHIFQELVGINPHTISFDNLKILAEKKIDPQLKILERNDYLDLLFSKVIETALSAEVSNSLSGVFIYDYPAGMSALAKINSDKDGYEVAARFELFLNGIEIANGYHELIDSHELLNRFKAEQHKREHRKFPIYPLDHRLLDALKHGIPDCAGVALGIDRLLMLMLKTNEISDVLAFDFKSA